MAKILHGATFICKIPQGEFFGDEVTLGHRRYRQRSNAHSKMSRTENCSVDMLLMKLLENKTIVDSRFRPRCATHDLTMNT